MYYKLAQLILTPGKKSSSLSDIFIAQPDTAKEALFGKLFIIAEIENNSIDGIKIINFLFDELNRNYYQNEKVLLAEKISVIRPENIFEAALAKTNINLSEFITNEKIRLSLKTINITVGLIHEKNLHFTNTGKNRVLFVYKQKMPDKNKNTAKNKNNHFAKTEEEYQYKISDITKQTFEPDAVLDEPKLFTNVISGKILENSAFFIANEALPEYISSKQLIEIITTLPPASAVEQFKQILSKINSYVAFLGVLVKSTSIESIEEQKKFLKQTTQDSINILNRTENTTENLLTPPGMIDFKKWLKFAVPFLSFFSRKNPTLDNSISLKDKIFFKRKSFSTSSLFKVIDIVKSVILQIMAFAVSAIRSFGSKEKIIAAVAQAWYKVKAGVNGTIFLIKNLSLKNKILLSLAALFLVVFGINLFIIKNKNLKKAEESEYKNLSTMIEQKQNQAEANLLYNNEEGAKKLFAEIKGLLDQYPQQTEEQKKELNTFKQKYELQLEKIRRVTRIDNPVSIIDTLNANSQANPENIIFNAATNKIYIGDSSQKSIYILNIATKELTTVFDLKKPINTVYSPLISEKKLLYYNNDGIIELDTAKEELKILPLNKADKNQELSGMALFNNNLYFIDNKDGQILRFDKTANAYSAPKKWLKNGTSFTDGVDIAIDGNIYILQKNGELLKFLKGEKETFNLGLVEPPLSDTNALKLNADSKYIFVMEKSHKRIIMFDKSGNFILQYYSDKFDKLKSFTVDEKNKLIYVLNGSEILSFKAEKL